MRRIKDCSAPRNQKKTKLAYLQYVYNEVFDKEHKRGRHHPQDTFDPFTNVCLIITKGPFMVVRDTLSGSMAAPTEPRV